MCSAMPSEVDLGSLRSRSFAGSVEFLLSLGSDMLMDSLPDCGGLMGEA